MKFLRYLGIIIMTALLPSLAMAETPTPGDKLTDFAIQKINGLIDGVQKTLPTVTHYAMQVTSMGCLVSLLQLIPWIILCFVMWFLTRVVFLKEKDWDDPSWGLLSVVLGIVSLVLTARTVVDITSSIWLAICVLHPDLYLIHLAVQKVTG